MAGRRVPLGAGQPSRSGRLPAPRWHTDAGGVVSESDLAIVAALIVVWGATSARLARFDVTAPIVFVVAGLALTHGPLAPLGYQPSNETIKGLAEITLALVLFSDASRVGLHEIREASLNSTSARVISASPLIVSLLG